MPEDMSPSTPITPLTTPTPPTPPKSRVDELWEKGWKNFSDWLFSNDKANQSGLLAKAHSYLTMAHKEAGEDVEARKGIAGQAAFVLVSMDDYKNAEIWANYEFAINPRNVWARLAWYHIQLNKLIGHKSVVLPPDGSGFGIFASLISTGVDVGRVGGKKAAVKQAGLDAAKALEERANAPKDDVPANWVVFSLMLLSIIDNMWTNGMKDRYMCDVILKLPWSNFKEEELDKEIRDAIEEIEVSANGFLGRMG